MAERTPESWEVGEEDSFGFPVYSSTDGGIPRFIARTISKTNAHKIAAAPELIAALELMENAFISSHVSPDQQQALDAAKSVLAKAKGESSGE